MSVIYTMTFGSFIGFVACFPLAIKVISGYQHVMVAGVMNHDIPNLNGPSTSSNQNCRSTSALMFGWIGAFIGALIRPIGCMIADKFGGAWVMHICSFFMIASAVGIGFYMKLAYNSATPEIALMGFAAFYIICIMINWWFFYVKMMKLTIHKSNFYGMLNA